MSFTVMLQYLQEVYYVAIIYGCIFPPFLCAALQYIRRGLGYLSASRLTAYRRKGYLCCSPQTAYTEGQETNWLSVWRRRPLLHSICWEIWPLAIFCSIAKYYFVKLKVSPCVKCFESKCTSHCQAGKCLEPEKYSKWLFTINFILKKSLTG